MLAYIAPTVNPYFLIWGISPIFQLFPQPTCFPTASGWGIFPISQLFPQHACFSAASGWGIFPIFQLFPQHACFDMYPLYWTTSKEGIFMRYSYEFKLMCVELYHSGLYPDIPEDTNPDTLKRHIREWSGLVDLHGPEVLKHKVFNKVWTPEEKLELVLKVIAGIPKRKVATEAGISPGILYQWIYKYKSQGYNGLVGSKKGRSTKELKMKKSTNPLPLTESEREELMRLRSENEYIKAENEIIKKRIALRQEKWAAQLKAKKQQSSRTSEKKDTN